MDLAGCIFLRTGNCDPVNREIERHRRQRTDKYETRLRDKNDVGTLLSVGRVSAKTNDWSSTNIKEAPRNDAVRIYQKISGCDCYRGML